MVRREVGGLVVVIADKDSGEDVERWEFGVEALGVGQKVGKTGSGQQAVPGTDETKASGGDKENAGAAGGEDREPPKSEEDVQAEIRALFRQITASVTFLPQLDAGSYTFNVLVYADKKSQVPVEWGDSEAREIEGGEKVRLRGFSTDNHRVGTVVSYKVGD